MAVAGSIAYQITLDSDQFIRNLAKATAAFFAFKTALKTITDPFAEGFRLRVLSKETNQTISSLVKLQWGAKAVGLEADQVTTIITRFQRALGGVTQEGRPLQYVIGMLGLNIQKLRQMDTVSAFKEVANSVAKLNTNSASFVMTKLVGGFGAMGAGAMGLARSMKDVVEGMDRASAKAALMEKFAETFYQIERRLTLIKDTAMTLFAGIAAGAGGGILHLLQKVDQFMARNSQRIIDIGQKIGSVISVIAAAFENGKIIELLKKSFMAAIEFLANHIVRMFFALAATVESLLSDAFENAAVIFGNSIKAQIRDTIKLMVAAGIPVPGLARFIPNDAKTVPFGQIKDNAIASFMAALDSWKDIFGSGNQNALKALYESLKKLAEKFIEVGQKTPKPEEGNILGGILHLEPTSIEKMGFHFTGGTIRGQQDFARQTAQNTYGTLYAVQETNRLLGGGGLGLRTGGFANP